VEIVSSDRVRRQISRQEAAYNAYFYLLLYSKIHICPILFTNIYL